MSQPILITGGAGFIGSHLAERLKAAGHTLTLIDNLSTGRRANVAPLLDDRCRLIEADASEALTDPALYRRAQAIYHLAADVGVKRIVEKPAHMVANNVMETDAVLAAASAAAVPVLIASSSEVYGKGPDRPLHEEMDLAYGPTTASRWSYGLTKALNEHMALRRAEAEGLGVVITRLFNTIGPRQVGHYGMVVPRFVTSGLTDQPIPVYGDGQQTRSFCDVRDVTDAMIRLMASPACHGRVYNVGSQQPVTIDALADLVIELTGATAGKRYVPYAEVYGDGFEDPRHRRPDVSRLREAIGFTPARSLRSTLSELIGIARGEAEPERVS